MNSEVSGYLRSMTLLARRARKVFLIAVGVCGLLALNLMFGRRGGTGPLAELRASFGPLLLWALTAAAYAFFLLATINARMTRKVADVVAADRARAVRQLQTIRARLEWSASTDND